MAAIKEVAAGSSSQAVHTMPSRLIASSICQTWQMAERKGYNERELVEWIQRICQEYGRRYAREVSIKSYQTLPPEAVSIPNPPERAWLFHLRLIGLTEDQTSETLELIAILNGSEVRIISR